MNHLDTTAYTTQEIIKKIKLRIYVSPYIPTINHRVIIYKVNYCKLYIHNVTNETTITLVETVFTYDDIKTYTKLVTIIIYTNTFESIRKTYHQKLQLI